MNKTANETTNEITDAMVRNAIVRYLQLRGMEILDENFHGFIVFKDTEEIVFGRITTGNMLSDKLIMPQREYEEAMIDWFSNQEDKDISIRQDVIMLHIVGEHRALVKHYQSAPIEEER